jgi:hypothetical protein
MITIVKLDGRLRSGTVINESSSGSSVRVVVGHRRVGVTAGSSPGAGFRKVHGQPRKWVRMDAIHETKTVPAEDVFQSIDWPIGVEAHGADQEAVYAMVRALVEKAIEAGGVGAKRTRPKLDASSLEIDARIEGLPIPSAEEFEAMCKDAWTSIIDGGKRRVVQNKAITTPPPIDKSEQIPDGFFRASNGDVMHDNKENHTADAAMQNGWPMSIMSGSTMTDKGKSGFTLGFMSKNKFDPAKHAK